MIAALLVGGGGSVNIHALGAVKIFPRLITGDMHELIDDLGHPVMPLPTGERGYCFSRFPAIFGHYRLLPALFINPPVSSVRQTDLSPSRCAISRQTGPCNF